MIKSWRKYMSRWKLLCMRAERDINVQYVNSSNLFSLQTCQQLNLSKSDAIDTNATSSLIRVLVDSSTFRIETRFFYHLIWSIVSSLRRNCSLVLAILQPILSRDDWTAQWLASNWKAIQCTFGDSHEIKKMRTTFKVILVAFIYLFCIYQMLPVKWQCSSTDVLCILYTT